MYLYQDSQYQYFSLHDCRVKSISFQEGILSFILPEGCWILAEHPQNDLGKTVKTGACQVDYEIIEGREDEIDIFLFKKKRWGKTIREAWSVSDWIEAVNQGRCEVELVTEYHSYQSCLWQCYVWFDKPPYHDECEIILPMQRVVYQWNTLCLE